MKQVLVVLALVAMSGCATFAQENVNVNKVQMLYLYQHCIVTPGIAKDDPEKYCKQYSGISEEEAVLYCEETQGFSRAECERTIANAKKRLAEERRLAEAKAKAVAFCREKYGKSETDCARLVARVEAKRFARLRGQ